MQKANVRLRLNKVGSCVPVVDCTPAQALLLHVLHQGNNGGSTFGDKMDNIELNGEAEVILETIPEEHIAEQVIPAKVQAAVPASGTPGQPDFKPAQAEKVLQPAKTIPAFVKPAVVHKRLRTDNEELRRLTKLYGHCVTKKGDSIIRQIWNGTNITLPQKFSELKWSEISYNGTEVAPLDIATGKPI